MLIIIIFSLVVSSSLGVSSAAITTFHTGFNLDVWESNSDSKGRLAYIPISIETQGNDFSLSFLTGYANTDYDSQADETSQSIETSFDTKVNISYKLIDTLPVSVLIGLDLNLPTGKRNLNQEQLVLYNNPDLSSIQSYGEGFNINPTLSFAKGWGKWMAGIGLGYLWTGNYNYSTEIKDYDPGDIYNIFAQLNYYYSPNWQIRTFGNYANFGIEKVQKQDFFQEGEFFLLGLKFLYSQPKWDADASIQTIKRGKRKFSFNSQIISKESKNSIGDEWITAISFRQFLNEKTIVSYLVKYSRLNDNDFPDDDPLFTGKKEKFTGGVGVLSVLGRDFSAELDIHAFVLSEGKNWFHFNKEQYKGLLIKGSLTKSF